MDRCSFFIKGKALFGSFPTQQAVDILEQNGVVCFVDLTHTGERGTVPYNTPKQYIKYPITDRDVPQDWTSFSHFIIQLADVIHKLKGNEKLYIHCKGGHGRSGIVVASLLCHIYNMNPERALRVTSYCHAKRKEMREKWRILGSPQNKEQKKFVCRFFRPIVYSDTEHPHNPYYGFSDISNYTVKVGTNEFESVAQALQCIGTFNIQTRYELLRSKFIHHTKLRDVLVQTYLRPLIYKSTDYELGYPGNNQHGIMLVKIRESLRQ